jgi:hypothetical protein
VRTASVLLLAALLWAQPAPRPVPIDNPQVRVVDALDQPRSRGPLHEHKADRVMVYLTDCNTRIAEPGGKVEEQHWRAGQVAWSPARGPHTSQNLTDKPCRIIEIELKQGAGRTPVLAGSLDPVKVDPAHYTVELENDRVRVMRARYAPGESGALHQHDRDRVTIFLTPAELEIVTPDGKREVSRRNRFDVTWGTVSRHQEKNLAKTPFEVVAVEMKAR